MGAFDTRFELKIEYIFLLFKDCFSMFHAVRLTLNALLWEVNNSPDNIMDVDLSKVGKAIRARSPAGDPAETKLQMGKACACGTAKRLCSLTCL